MRAWTTTLRRFLVGIAKRWWAFAVGVVVGAADLIQLLRGEAVNVPNWAVWTSLGAGLLVAVLGTYHEVRVEGERAVDALATYRNRSAAAMKLADQQAIGNGIRAKCDKLGDAAYEILAHETNQWCLVTRDLLLKEAPQYVAEFERDSGSGYSYEGFIPMGNLKVRLDGRLKRLGRIVERLSTSG